MLIKFTCRYSSHWCHKRSWSQHQNCKRFGYSYYLREFMSISEFLNLVPQELILVMAPELQEDLLGTKDELDSSNIYLYL